MPISTENAEITATTPTAMSHFYLIPKRISAKFYKQAKDFKRISLKNFQLISAKLSKRISAKMLNRFLQKLLK